LKRLRAVLSGLEVARLGEWTWILVRSEDWRPILRRAHRDPDSPAFTILEKRQTFLEEALFIYRAPRSRTLLEKWRVPLDYLLLFAVSHELGHALCHETSEVLTEAYAAQLRSAGRTTCAASKPAATGPTTSSLHVRTIQRAVTLLPNRGLVISVMDADEANPDVRERLHWSADLASPGGLCYAQHFNRGCVINSFTGWAPSSRFHSQSVSSPRRRRQLRVPRSSVPRYSFVTSLI
jgi:hypothetical protein